MCSVLSTQYLVLSTQRKQFMSNRTSLSRRSFHRTALATAGLAALPRLTRGESKFPPGDYVDMHTHLGQTWNTTVPLTAEELLRWMDAKRIAQAVVLPLVSPESSSYLLTTDFVLQQTVPYRDRLIPFCSIDPRTSYSGGHKGLVAMLQKYIDAGAKGFGEHKNGLAFDDPRNMALYAACEDLKLPDNIATPHIVWFDDSEAAQDGWREKFLAGDLVNFVSQEPGLRGAP